MSDPTAQTEPEEPDGPAPPAPQRGAAWPAVRGRLRSALRYSFLDGLFTTVTIALVDSFAIPAALVLGAEEAWVGVLAGAGQLTAAFGHLLAPRFMARAPSRRALVVWCVRVQAMACFGFALSGLLPSGLALPAALAAYALYSAAGSLGFGPWASWTNDIVPRSGRGRFFALRSRWFGLVSGTVTVSAGLTMRAIWGGTWQVPWEVLALLLGLAGSVRVLASMFLVRQFEPAPRQRFPAEDFTYLQFLRKTGESNFANFTLALAIFTGGAFLTGPFFTKYLLQDLGFSYLATAGFSTVAMVSSMIFVRFWARLADRWGNLLVLRISTLAISFIPLLYLGNGELPMLIAGWVIGGACWGGVGLASFNFVSEAVTPQRRVRCYAYMQATIGIVVACFMFFFGAVAGHLPLLFHHRLQTVFLISVVLRLLPALVLLLLVREVGGIHPRAKALEVFYELPAVRPTMDFLRGAARPFTRS
jgi:MFS family permease